MHKRLVNHCTIALKLIPDGPILIKSGREGADPTKPQMEFVETYHHGKRSIYLPGSSLKGAIRAHAERIVRTVGRDKRPTNPKLLWANDPLTDDYKYLENKSPSEIYQLSSFTDRIFGNTSIASRLRIEDAYPSSDRPLKLEERNGVAIDRVFGSVAVGPFDYQVCTEGEFITKIHLKNFTLSQLGLIGLVLRDLDDGWFGIGFAKSRGLGTVNVQLESGVVQYPGCILNDGQIQALGSEKTWDITTLLGAGAFLSEDECRKYDFIIDDKEDTPVAAQNMDLGLGVYLLWQGEKQVKDLFTRGVKAWKRHYFEGVAA
ncbi:RAMP superfamily CRISPR-associated protein [Merismopedia glauca]|uniref:CRISPR-associated protein n=1 Tax=Merismopedia glauca CCAP 1448/3 TaxID=1296344 RepID=A0A2T1BZY4_9CYAN|nr:RAMP superfamily CRISPR-associated protein [Merismopedia glauca]PSB01552.1 CRISPR-associated protein [Merismopedia glauca CCAP 1448/3]